MGIPGWYRSTWYKVERVGLGILRGVMERSAEWVGAGWKRPSHPGELLAQAIEVALLCVADHAMILPRRVFARHRHDKEKKSAGTLHDHGCSEV